MPDLPTSNFVDRGSAANPRPGYGGLLGPALREDTSTEMTLRTARWLLPAIFIGASAAGCAQKADNIAPAYISHIQYGGLSCDQIAQEMQRVSSHLQAASGVQNKKATGDVIKTTVGVVIFWPALLFTSGDGQTASEVARLKGNMQALEQASVSKKCSIKLTKVR